MATAPAPQGRKRGATHSGRLLLRMPETLHSELARASERAGVSLNGYINEILGGAVGGRQRPAPRSRNRYAERLLLANLVVIVVVGALALVLLVQAIR
jgi:hypothetical protein